MRFLHTSDWQIGMPLSLLGTRSAAARAQRVDTVREIFRLAKACEVDFVVVAGDIFDANDVAPADIARIGEIVGSSGIRTFMLAGNHDYLAPSCALLHAALTSQPNVTVFRGPEAHEVPGGYVLGNPATLRWDRDDPTAALAELATPADAIRVGVAHGALQRPDLDLRDLQRPIPLDATVRCRLDYLALGDWHSYLVHETPEAGPAVYSGTHEQTAFDDRDPGWVAIVEIDAPRKPARIRRERVGRLRWLERSEVLSRQDRPLEAVLAASRAEPHSEQIVMRLRLSGLASPEEIVRIATLEAELAERFYYFELDADRVSPQPGDLGAWMEGLPPGVWPRVVERLFETLEGVDDERRLVARRALELLRGELA